MRGLWFWGCRRGYETLGFLDFGGVSDEERDGEVEAAAASEALHHDTVRQRDRE